jgi:glycosyltransferase involved in cell wall biosynthesis
MGTRISAVINTLNEEKNLPYALRSVCTWVDEMVVVDMHSTDRTVDIARTFGAKVYLHKPENFVEPARAFAISLAAGDWIMILDADEIVTQPLSCKLCDIAKANGDISGVKIPRLNYLLGGPLYFTGWGPHQDKHIRFFKRGSVSADSAIHSALKPKPGARILDLPYQKDYAIVHFNYLNTAQFIEKLNRYTTIEAQQAMERGKHVTVLRAAAAAIKQFLFRYVRQNGFRDGWRGFYLSLFMAFYVLAKYAKLQEIITVGQREVVEDYYRKEAERILMRYEVEASGPCATKAPED